MLPTFTHSGPAKSSPVTIHGLLGCTRSAGRDASISCPRSFLAILQRRHVWRTFLMDWRALKIQNCDRNSNNTILTPRWCNMMCVCSISSSVKWWDPSRRSGCFCHGVRMANSRCPPNRMRPSSRKGLYRTILDLVGVAVFSVSATYYAGKLSCWAIRIQRSFSTSNIRAVKSPLSFSERVMLFVTRRIQAITRKITNWK